MYDGHKYGKDYRTLKDLVVDIENGDVTDYDADELADRIQESYDEGGLTSSQYDDLMRYVLYM